MVKGIITCAFSNTFEPSFVVQGKEMHYEPKKNQSDVVGNARATRILSSSAASHPSRTQTLTADRFHINFISETLPSPQPQNIDTITAEGNVSFQEEDLSIQAHRCVYDCKTNIVTCHGQILLTKGQNTLKGNKAEANLESGRYTVTGHSESDTVQAVLLPNSVS